MQVFGPRTSSKGTVYTAAQIQAAMLAPVLREDWKWDRLDQAGNYLDDLTGFVEREQAAPRVSYDTSMAVKRQLTIRFKGDVPLYKGRLLSLNNQVRGHYLLGMPDGGFVDFAIGTFIVLPAGGETAPSLTWYDLQGFDYAQLLIDYSFLQATSVPAGPAIAAIAGLLAIPGGLTPLKMNIPDLGRLLVQPITWDGGMSRLKAINDILEAINYFPAWFDGYGVMRSAPIPDWNTVSPVFTFDSTQQGSIILVPMRQSVDWAQAGNIQTVYVEDPRRPAFSATYINSNPLSPISTVYYHPKTLPPIRDPNIPDAVTAGLRAKAACQAAARLFQTWRADTPAWPMAEDQDVLGVTYTTKDEGTVHAVFVESGWTMTCKPGSSTSHSWSQLVAA